MSIARHFTSLLVKQSLSTAELWPTTAGYRLPRFALLLAAQPSAHLTHQQRLSFHTSGVRCESALGKLRKKTGYAFALCRKALELHDQDMAKAEKWLRAEALKQGWEKAERVKTRTTGEGLIGIYTTQDQSSASMVEVKCETDFVAKNENFISLVTKLAERLSEQSAAIYQSVDSRETGSSLNKLWIVDEKKLNEVAGSTITETIAKLGENIRLVRACIIRITGDDSNVRLLPYTHAVAGKIASTDKNVILGKYGTIIAIQKGSSPQVEGTGESDATAEEEDGLVASDSLDDVGTKLGQHIIGLTPLTVAPVEAVDDAQAGDHVESAQGDEEPTALLKQKFIFNDEITVEQFLANSRAKVLDFVRFECGQETN